MIKGYKPDSDITIMDATYRRPKPGPDGKYDDGSMTIVYKDNLTKKKGIQYIKNPGYEYYMIDPSKRTSYNQFFIEKESAEKIIVPYKGLEKDIAERTGNMEFFINNIESGNRRENQKLHLHPSVFNSDSHIEDHYRMRFGRLYTNNIGSISKSFLDIEVDGIHAAGDFPELGECPINAITVIFKSINKVYTFLLRNPKNPQIAEFEASVNNGSIFQELKDFIADSVNKIRGSGMHIKYGVDKFEYAFLFYDEDREIDLIADVFNSINAYQPDFVLAWNMSFDIPYIIERIRALGYEPGTIMCHPDFPEKSAYYYIDERAKNEWSERGDHATISSYSIFIDQLIHFASRRKGQTKFSSFSLDNIGEEVAKVNKYDYKHITTNIAELPYKNYKIFAFYNIMDTIVQNCIECITQDVDYIFGKCIINNTRYHKGHRQTVYLTNRGNKDLYSQGFIMGNNANRFNAPPESKFPGAFVADPSKLNDYSKMKLFGNPIDVYENAADSDFASLYPSLIRQFNEAANTQIGMLIIDQIVYEYENKRKDPKWSRAGQFMEDFQSYVWIEFCYRWLHLAKYEELYDDVVHYFTNIVIPVNTLRRHNEHGLIIPVEFYGKDARTQPVIFGASKQPVIWYTEPNPKRMEEAREKLITNPNQSFKVG